MLKDVAKWPHEPVSWSAKAKRYNIRRKTNETTPLNGGQILKKFLKSQGVDISQFEKLSEGKDQPDKLKI